MTKYEMGLKMAKISEQNLYLTEKLSVAEKTIELAFKEGNKGNSLQSLQLLSLYLPATK